jgi:phosphoribosyl-AMP cyclohydrolase
MQQSDIAILEEGTTVSLDFSRLARLGTQGQAVVPVAIQNAQSLELLYIGYVNEEALLETLRTKRVVLWSTSRNKLWLKGATSGDYLDLVEVRINCEQNSLLFLVRPVQKGACHTRDRQGNTRGSCYYRRVGNKNGSLRLEHLTEADGESDPRSGVT